MDNLILTLHIIACVLLIVFVLLQAGKEGMGVIFGGGSSSLFGSAGAGGILVKMTTFLAIVFFCTSLVYNIVTSTSRASTESIIPQVNIEEPAHPAPAETPEAAGGIAPSSK